MTLFLKYRPLFFVTTEVKIIGKGNCTAAAVPSINKKNRNKKNKKNKKNDKSKKSNANLNTTVAAV